MSQPNTWAASSSYHPGWNRSDPRSNRCYPRCTCPQAVRYQMVKQTAREPMTSEEQIRPGSPQGQPILVAGELLQGGILLSTLHGREATASLGLTRTVSFQPS